MGVEEIPQIVYERYKTMNLLPLGPTKDEEEEEEEADDIDVKTEHSLSLGADEKEEIAQRKSEEMKKMKEKEEYAAMQKEMNSMQNVMVGKQHMHIVSGDESELSPLPPAKNESEENKNAQLKQTASSLFRLDDAKNWDPTMVKNEKKEMLDA